jgi:cytochrome P450 family 103
MSNVDESSRTGRSEPPTLSIAALDRDPHGVFRRHRTLTPLLQREDGSYIAIRAANVEELATDPRTRQMETELTLSRGVTEGALFDFMHNTMLYTNGKDHHRRRAPISRAVASRIVTELRPRIRAVAHALIDHSYARGEMNLLDDYAALLPARIISEILGLPEADIPRFTGWVYSFTRWFSFSLTREEVPEVQAAVRQLTDYVSELLADRRVAPRNDFLTSYISAIAEAGNLSSLETLVQVITVIVAGSDTTRGAMAIQVALLLQHPEQWEAVCRDASLIPGAVSEALRYEPSVGSFPRFTVDDVEIDGYIVPRNRLLTLSTLSAMRDPTLYAEPDSFTITRSDHPRRHPVFGAGAHRCLGEVLARAELEEGLAALVERVPRLQLAGEPPMVQGHSGVRRVSGVRVSWPA